MAAATLAVFVCAAALSFAAWNTSTVQLAQAYIAVEVLWFVFASRQRKRFGPPSETPRLSRGERQRVWENCLAAVPDVSVFVRGWFDNAPLERITLQDCKRWLAWGFWGKSIQDLEPADFEHIGGMVEDLARKHRITFREEARGEHDTRLLAFDREPFKSRHYPLLFYALTHGVVGSITDWLLMRRGFERQLDKSLMYWVRIGEKPSATPIVMAHGIGIGLLPYLGIIDGLVATGASVVLLDMPWISVKVCSEVPDRMQSVSSLRRVMLRNGLDRATFVGHSYGTVICGWMLRHSADMVVSVALLDPVVMLLNLSNCLYSFVYRTKGLSWIESLLRNDTYISHTLRRRFWWYENILFVQDIQVPSLIVTSQDDESVPVDAIHFHLAKELDGNKACQYRPRILNIAGQGHGGFLSCAETSKRVQGELRAIWERSLSREQLRRGLSRADTAEMEAEASAAN